MTDKLAAMLTILTQVPPAIWLTLFVTVLVSVVSAATAIIVVWRSNANSRANLREQLALASNHFGNQLDHDSRQLGKL